MFEANRSTIAKLLATENITVIQEKVSTASFDVKNRVLRLPLWSETTPETLDHLIGHEVGHALFTPLAGWHDAVCSKGSAFKSYLNVVEDARIEKLIQRKYPGLRSSFIKSYRKLLADGFFGGDIATINKMGLIDRINVYFKCGMSAGIKFETDERVWLKRIESAETWEQVQQIAEDLFAFAKQKAEEEEQARQEQYGEDDQDDEEDEWETENEFSDNFEDGESDEFDELFNDASQPTASDDAADDAEEDEDFEGDELQPNNGQTGAKAIEQQIESKTDETLRDSIQRELNTDSYDGEILNLSLPKVGNEYRDCVLSYKDILKNAHENTFGFDEAQKTEFMESLNRVGTACYADWREQNTRHVKLMVKEFEMRKRAGEFSRAMTSKTGVIDTVKMNNYKFSDDIFKKVTVLPEGKNHGFLMYIDMSGSMVDNIYATAEQVMLLAHFCKQTGVPFRAYGFSNANCYTRYDANAVLPGQPLDHNQVELIELFSERMTNSEMTQMSKYLLGSMAKYQTYNKRNRNRVFDMMKRHDLSLWSVKQVGLKTFELGGTPMNHAIVQGIPLAIDFRKNYRIDILNTFFLTDGASATLEWKPTNEEGRGDFGWGYTAIRSHSKRYYYMTNPWTGTRMGFKGSERTETEVLLQAYKEATGSNLIRYHIIPQTRRELDYCIRGEAVNSWGGAEDDQWKSFRTEGYLAFEAKGYDEFFAMSSKGLTIAGNDFGDIKAGSLSKARLRSAFSKSKTAGRNSRKMVSDLMKRVA